MPRKMGNAPVYARKRDDNEPEIIAVLEAAGAVVEVLDKPLDLLVAWQQSNLLLEVKNGRMPPSWQRITKGQQEFIDRWKDRGQYAIVSNPVEVLGVLGMSLEVFASRVAFDLAGTCKETPDFFESMPDEFCRLIDDEVLRCDDCDWWVELSEVSDGNQFICRDCAEGV